MAERDYCEATIYSDNEHSGVIPVFTHPPQPVTPPYVARDGTEYCIPSSSLAESKWEPCIRCGKVFPAGAPVASAADVELLKCRSDYPQKVRAKLVIEGFDGSTTEVDLMPAMSNDGAVREALIKLGWGPPGDVATYRACIERMIEGNVLAADAESFIRIAESEHSDMLAELDRYRVAESAALRAAAGQSPAQS